MNNGAIDQVAESLREDGWLTREEADKLQERVAELEAQVNELQISIGVLRKVVRR